MFVRRLSMFPRKQALSLQSPFSLVSNWSHQCMFMILHVVAEEVITMSQRGLWLQVGNNSRTNPLSIQTALVIRNVEKQGKDKRFTHNEPDCPVCSSCFVLHWWICFVLSEWCRIECVFNYTQIFLTQPFPTGREHITNQRINGSNHPKRLVAFSSDVQYQHKNTE